MKLLCKCKPCSEKVGFFKMEIKIECSSNKSNFIHIRGHRKHVRCLKWRKILTHFKFDDSSVGEDRVYHCSIFSSLITTCKHLGTEGTSWRIFGEDCGLQTGQLSTHTLLLWSHAAVIDAVCSLLKCRLCLNMQSLSWTSHRQDGSTHSSKTCR